jgi:hypothetical protein
MFRPFRTLSPVDTISYGYAISSIYNTTFSVTSLTPEVIDVSSLQDVVSVDSISSCYTISSIYNTTFSAPSN